MRQRADGVVQRHDGLVGLAAEIAGHQSHHQRDHAADGGDQDAERQRVAQRAGHLPEHILAARGGAEPMLQRRRHVRRHDIDGVLRRKGETNDSATITRMMPSRIEPARNSRL